MKGTVLWFQRLLYALLSMLLILFPLLPLGMESSHPVLPDMFFALTAAWVVRRPESAPFWLIAIMAMVADFMLSRPPGLWALLMLFGTEFLRGQRDVMRDRVYFNEWVTDAIVFALMILLNNLILIMSLVPTPRTGESWALLFATTLSFPIAVVVLHYVFFIRWPRPAERLRQFGRLA
jgi:rod shape-determining protein MreD